MLCGLGNSGSPIRNQTLIPTVKVPCPNHWITGKVPETILKSDFFFFLLSILRCMSPLYILDISPLLDTSFANILLFRRLPFVLLLVSFLM